MQLHLIPVGQVATVKSLGGEKPQVERFLEMGLVPGAKVRVLHRLPFGGPIVCRVHSSTFAFRKEDAALIEVSSET
jgi:ferrous iron transport protein B